MPAFCDHPHPLFSLCLPQHGFSVALDSFSRSAARRRPFLPTLFAQSTASKSLIFGCQSSVKPCQFFNIDKNIKVFILLFFGFLKIQN
jgi:hypothetical protein